MTQAQARLRIFSDGRAGHASQTLGLAEAMGLTPDLRPIAPRGVFAALAPFGPSDPREAAAVAPPFPDIAMGAGRRTLPYLRRLKRASGGRVFTVYCNVPANGLGAADLILAPSHDGLLGGNVLSPITPPNRVSAKALAWARENPDPRVEALATPRAALLVGGDSRHFRFSDATAAALREAARALRAQGFSVMASASRRTPDFVARALRAELGSSDGWMWDGLGDNPYFSLLALAQTIVVTADSVSMIGEAVATGAPAHVLGLAGTGGKIVDYLSRLESLGAVRPWRGSAEHWSYAPIQSTPRLAEEILRAYARFRSMAI